MAKDTQDEPQAKPQAEDPDYASPLRVETRSTAESHPVESPVDLLLALLERRNVLIAAHGAPRPTYAIRIPVDCTREELFVHLTRALVTANPDA